MKIPQSVVEARARLMVRAVFFSCILYDQAKLAWVDEPDPDKQVWRGIECRTAMTDGYNLIINLEFFRGLTVDERVFVLAHEVYHIMAMHPKRMRKYAVEGLFNMVFLPWLYNIAADAVINKCLTDSGIGKMPFGCVKIDTIGKYKVTGAETAEEIYKRLIDELPPSVKSKLAKGDVEDAVVLGSMGGMGASDPLGHDVIPVSPDAAAEHVNEAGMKAAIQSAQQQAKNQGTMPAGLRRFIEEFMEPQVHWEEVLRSTIISKAGTESTTWSKPNRRKIVTPGVYLPRRRGLRTGPVGVGWDTSGSVSPKEHQQFGGELASIFGDMRPEVIYLMWCDAKVDACIEMFEPEDLRVEAMVKGATGGGGTSFLPPFQYMIDHDIRVDTFIYFTDGYGPFPSEELVQAAGVRELIWCISNSTVGVPFGTRVEVTF